MFSERKKNLEKFRIPSGFEPADLLRSSCLAARFQSKMLENHALGSIFIQNGASKQDETEYISETALNSYITWYMSRIGANRFSLVKNFKVGFSMYVVGT